MCSKINYKCIVSLELKKNEFKVKKIQNQKTQVMFSLIPDKFTLFSIFGEVPAYDCNINPRQYIKTILIVGGTFIVYKELRKALSNYSKNNKLILSDIDEI